LWRDDKGAMAIEYALIAARFARSLRLARKPLPL
jgi:Flp pilus assembly pilin Flp